MEGAAVKLDTNRTEVTPPKTSLHTKPETRGELYVFDPERLKTNVKNILAQADADDTKPPTTSNTHPQETKAVLSAEHHAYTIMSPILHGLAQTGKDGEPKTDAFHNLPEAEKMPVAIACIRYIGITTFFKTVPEYAAQNRKQIITELFAPELNYAYLIAKNLHVLLTGSNDPQSESAKISDEIIKTSTGRLGLTQHIQNFPGLSMNAYNLLGEQAPYYQKMFVQHPSGEYYEKKSGPHFTPMHSGQKKKTAIEREEELFRQQQFGR